MYWTVSRAMTTRHIGVGSVGAPVRCVAVGVGGHGKGALDCPRAALLFHMGPETYDWREDLARVSPRL